MPHYQLAILLGMTVALGPLALDAYLPAFPAIAGDLGVSKADVGLTLSAYVFALGLAQLIGGPLSDRYGRQRVLLLGLAVFAAAAFMVAQADSLNEMLAWRVVQGVGGAFCAVSVPAIVRDQCRGNEAARLFGLIGLVMFIAPASAPALGSALLAVSNWPAIYYALGGYALLLGVLLHYRLFRRIPVRVPARTPVQSLVTNYLLVLRHRVAMRFIALQTLAFSAMLVFITHASFIYQGWFGFSSSAFAALFAANVAAMAVLNLVNRRLLLRFPSVHILRTAVATQHLAIALLILLVLLDAPSWAVVACLMAVTGCMGAIVPNSLAGALDYFPNLGGTAAALLGATQFTVAGAVSALSTRLAGEALLPIVLIMAVCSLGAVLLANGAPRAVQRQAAMQATPQGLDAPTPPSTPR
ncbi:Bcr/CflA family efflux MFS transporter [Alkalilimnicola ehrlichii MLHE-1]|uniref:Bcr/CflA family efflux transporter n=1 Tax=Alkalilimnicola ehrlichii (strain ATCC BAA-1101 / DSM 17681 / MLHE-1) TaxID=187272 RepID=Q0A9G2_ALKEH|nr:Bcr/CflA family efflux MFS transporter [Alkalilimnicola ehrlichii]ABI56525.1 drug resistance transporter, Bcr/CflA subfamily [Alkalilimnicola ehrlichii MLHE-1]